MSPPEDETQLRRGEREEMRLLEYVNRVWASTDEYLATVDPATLDATVTIRPLGEMPAIRALAQVCVGHGFLHVGEIELARTLVGA